MLHRLPASQVCLACIYVDGKLIPAVYFTNWLIDVDFLWFCFAGNLCGSRLAGQQLADAVDHVFAGSVRAHYGHD